MEIVPVADLKVEGLKKRIDDFVLQADFYVQQGERAALVGRSGSGKTTLLRVLAGLESIDEGRIFLGKDELTQLPARNRRVGLVFQDQALFPSMTVMENITFPLTIRKVKRGLARAEALEWLSKVDLLKHAESSIETLSGGERQRVAFVRALIWKPRLLLLDEPFSALDRELRATLCRELVEMHRLWPVPMVLVTHDELDIESVATFRLTLNALSHNDRDHSSVIIHSVERH
ncbi:MAG: hypothetical protein A2Z97_06230 [Bdellovibrionales bacterium GWB1_52_6]|nr:MAG: hypothetical protein A2Z97_06230 [Bdellovibrionales bacterium GWB1_52_6]OFZ06100.1 MAG: hypothetical protein A2X97_02070 [Bdellovibrionales bacterium GWA1_52_35]